MSTNIMSAKDIQRSWHVVDAKNKILGRLATEIATILMGKNKPNYVPYLNMADSVVVVNASKIKVTGKKESQKTYTRHSGYPGGLRVRSYSEVKETRPEELITHAVKGMVPKTKLGRQLIKKLHVFSGTEHPFKKQIKEETVEKAAEEQK